MKKACERCINRIQYSKDGTRYTLAECIEYYRKKDGDNYKVEDGIWFETKEEWKSGPNPVGKEKWIILGICEFQCPYELERMVENDGM